MMPEGVIEIWDAMEKSYQATRGEARVLQSGLKR
jgi:hypothetical protein